MRNGFGVAAGAIVLAWFAVAALSPPPGTKVKVSPNAAANAGKLPRAKAAAMEPLPPGVSYFSGQECTDLGGTINLDTAGVCSSGQFCKRVDNQGVEHRMCITVGQ